MNVDWNADNSTHEEGTMGFYCSHTYAHNRAKTESLMPYALKGVDATLFPVFHALGMNVTVRPILGTEAWDEYDERCWENAMDGEWEEQEDWLERNGRAGVTRVGMKFASIDLVDVITENEDPSRVCVHLSILSYLLTRYSLSIGCFLFRVGILIC
jgi:hypothetical protein